MNVAMTVPMIAILASTVFFGCGLLSCVIAQRKGYRPWFWPLSLGPVGTLLILAKASLSRATTPEIRETWERRADWTGGVLSGLTLLLMCPAAFIVLFGISVATSAPATRMVLSAASVDGVTVKHERPGSSSVNSSISPFTDGNRKGTRYTNIWLDRSGAKVGQSVVEIANGDLRIDGKDYGTVSKDDTVEIVNDRVTVNGKSREVTLLQP
nr:hypothetical protein Hi04_10k_c5016_00031 [uncultured bacterium]